MNFINSNIKWIMRISGILTCTMIVAAIFPQTSLQFTFGSAPELTPMTEIIVRNWGALVTIVGILLLYCANQPVTRKLALMVAAASKIIFIALILTLGKDYLATAGIAIAIDSIFIIIFSLYLLGSLKK